MTNQPTPIPLPSDKRTPGVPSPVTLDDDSIAFDGFRCANPTVIDSAARYRQVHGPQADLAGWADQALDLAARVESIAAPSLDLSLQTQRLDELQKKFSTGVIWFRDQLGEVVRQTTGSDGALTHAIAGQLERLERDLTALVGDESSPLRAAVAGQLAAARSDLVAEVSRGRQAQTQLVQQILAPTSESNPLRVYLEHQQGANREVLEHLAQLTEHLTAMRQAAAVSDERNRGPAKGDSPEQSISAVLARIAHAVGDDYEATGRQAGRAGEHAWVGDHLVTINEAFLHRPARLALESKNQKLGTGKWIAEATEAMGNRDAQAYVGIVAAPEQVPTGGRVALLRPNVLVVHHDPTDSDDTLLIAIIRLMRAQAISALMADGAGHDTAAVTTLLGRALAGVQDFDQITKRANTIRTNIDAIDNTAGRIRQVLEDDIAKALRLLSSATLEAA